MEQNESYITRFTGSDLPPGQEVLGFGCIMLCESGTATLSIELNDYRLAPGDLITLFPTDIVQPVEASADFSARAFCYSDRLLREASMHMEQSVYSLLRDDRVCGSRAVVDEVARPMFKMLEFYFASPSQTTSDIAMLQLKSFFLGFYDFMQRYPGLMGGSDTSRADELFGRFMDLLEHDYMASRGVEYYASRLCITRKYLGMIARRKTGKTPKQLIDEYVVAQLKLRLRTTNDSVRQIAQAFGFADDSLMIRYFRKHTGLTPEQFRRQM